MNQDALDARQLYNDQSDIFTSNQATNPDVQKIREVVGKLIKPKTNDTILFAGCGDGVECSEASSLGSTVVGIDISEKNVEKANRLQLKNATFHVMDIQALAFDDATFDNVISILAIMYVEDIQTVLKGFRRILKDTGSIIVVVPHTVIKMMKYNSKNDYFLRGKQWEEWKGVKRFNYYRLIEDYVEEFTKAGLAITHLLEPTPATDANSKEISYPHFVIFELIPT